MKVSRLIVFKNKLPNLSKPGSGVTTASFTGNSRLWRVHFSDPADPAAGGTIEMLLDITEGQKMMDNLAINHRGQIIIQEDSGNQVHLAKIWLSDTPLSSLERKGSWRFLASRVDGMGKR
ncbi:MAG: hypothetical protein ACM33V_11060 [Chloroflexota bacterium]|nr:hypothetical protein [Anaerolineales bacterium]